MVEINFANSEQSGEHLALSTEQLWCACAIFFAKHTPPFQHSLPKINVSSILESTGQRHAEHLTLMTLIKIKKKRKKKEKSKQVLTLSGALGKQGA